MFGTNNITVSSAIDLKNTNTVSLEDKCTEELKTIMDETTDNKEIPVYIWYRDIDQGEVDEATKEVTGLTPEDCDIIEELPIDSFIMELNTNDCKTKNEKLISEINNYINSTSNVREKEQELTYLYTKNHREISKAKYIEKSKLVEDELSINKEDVIFKSQYTPMILANMTSEEILYALDSDNIEEIGYCDEYKIEQPLANEDFGYNSKECIGVNDVYSSLNLSGAGVNVGLIEINVPGDIGTDEDFEIDYDDITIVKAPDKTVSTGWHANNTCRVLCGSNTGIAPSINLYATTADFENIEELLSYNINVIEVNISYLIYERIYSNLNDPNSTSVINNDYGYTYIDKYYDHIFSNHNIVTVVAGGNKGYHESDWCRYNSETGKYSWEVGPRITSPGLAYNAITVGAFDNNYTGSNYDDDFLCYYSSWKNSNEDIKGCEKPDVLMPANYYGGGTSVSSPALTGIIALMLELKPSLALTPELVKSIVLASCHRKVIQTSEQGNQETIYQGISERQGAGVPNALTMVCIVSQGTYGFGTIGGSTRKIHITQPRYDANNMNVSITWIKENSITGDHADANITEGYDKDLDLNVYQNDQVISSSLLRNSSTEMCYFRMRDSVNNYLLHITQRINPSVTRFAYAWSTDEIYCSDMSEEGIYYIKNNYSEKLMIYNNSNSVSMKAINTPNDFSGEEQWILKKAANGKYVLLAGNEEMEHGLSTNSNIATLSISPALIDLIRNDDGTVSFVSDEKILSFSNSNCTFVTYNANMIATRQKWCLEKINFRTGDANLDGIFDINDAYIINKYSIGITNLNSIQKFLADFNNDGVINILDSTEIQRMLISE